MARAGTWPLRAIQLQGASRRSVRVVRPGHPEGTQVHVVSQSRMRSVASPQHAEVVQ